MKFVLTLSAALFAVALTAHAEERRELGAHQHGHGTLDIALDGPVLAVELTAPGADIAGFEHEARTAADKEMVTKAKVILSQAERVVRVDAAGGCSLTEAAVDTGHGQGTRAGAHTGHSPHEEHGEHDARGGGEHGLHSEFHVTYAFKCANADAITSIALPYFESFPNAEELEVTIITPKGQFKREATRQSPSVSLADTM